MTSRIHRYVLFGKRHSRNYCAPSQELRLIMQNVAESESKEHTHNTAEKNERHLKN